jgi:hypothetical protein
VRPYVAEVEFNIQRGGKYALGPKTLIVGPNTVGKSSIVRTIELACSGRASDIAGRETLALDADLWALAGDGVGIAECVARFSDGGSATWSLTRGKKAQRTGTVAAFPIRDVRSAILGSAETARKFFLSVASRITWEEAIAEVPTQFHDRLTPYKSADGAAGLLGAIEGLKKRVRDLNSDARAQRSVVMTTSQGIAPPPSEKDIARAKEAAAFAARSTQTAQAQARIAEIDREITSAETELSATAARSADVDAKWAALPPPLPPIVEHAIAVGEYLAAHGGTECVICGAIRPAGTFGLRVEKAKKIVTDARAVERDRAFLDGARHGARSAVAEIGVTLERLRNERESLKSIVGEAPAAFVGAPDAESLIRTAERWNAIRAAEGRAVQLETEAKIIGQTIALVQTAVERLLDRARSDFEAAVQRYLPAPFRFGLDLKDGEREVCRVGLRTAAGLRTALSGAEWSAMTAALASAVAERTRAIQPNDPVIVVPEDRDFDPKMLAEVMRSFVGFDGQVIITGTKHPAAPVDGWTVVELGSSDVNFCVGCNAEISIGTCPHGVRGIIA